MRPSTEEQEVTVSFCRTDKVARVYASDTRYINKFDRLVENNPDSWKLIRVETCEGDVVGKIYECPVELVSFRSKKGKKNLTEEQRAELAERLKRIRRNLPENEIPVCE